MGNATCMFAYVCLVIFLTCNFAKASAGPEVFEYRDGFISLKGDGLSLLSLLQRISESAGIELLVVGPVSPRPVTLDMIDKPVEEALRSILRGYSYSAVYSDGSAGRVNIIGARGGSKTNPNARNSNDQNLLTNPLVTSQKEKEESSAGQALPFASEERECVGNVDRSTSGYQTSAVENHEAIAQKVIAQRSIAQSKTNREQSELKPGLEKAGTEQTEATEQAEAAEQQSEATEQAEVIARAASATRERGYSVFIEELERRIESGQSDRDYEIWTGIKAPIYVEHDQVRLERYRELIED